MTKSIGKVAGWALLLLLSQTALLSQAAVDATVDRQRAALGDTLQLVISATEDDEDLGTVSLDALMRDWEVLSRNTRSNTTIMNGKRTHNRQLQIQITPLRTGSLLIPRFQVGAGRTAPIQVEIGDAPQVDPGKETILFEATVDRESVYVQGQLILTLRLQQAINLDGRSISDLQLPGAFVVPLEQKSFQRRVNGRPWLVHEVRYAIFPEQSGVLEIPAQSFSARESAPRRSVFDNARGRVVRLNSKSLQVEVLPRPAGFPAGTWLPARNIIAEEEWSADPTKLRAGESITRTVRLRGEGLQGAQLPPVLLASIPGVKQYPDQPSIADSEISTGLLGSRTDSVAVVATRAGEVTIPAIEVPWWDTESQSMQTTVIAARTLQVAPADLSSSLPIGSEQAAQQTHSPNQASSAGSSRPWQLIALLCALGWASTLFLLLRRKKIPVLDRGDDSVAPTGKAAYKSLLAACAANHPEQARKHLIQWSAALGGSTVITSLEQAARAADDPELSAEVAALERTLYSRETGPWDGTSLSEIVKRLRREGGKSEGIETEALSLYP